MGRVMSKAPADPRAALPIQAKARKESLAALSRMLRRPERYLATFVREGKPTALTAEEHELLAAHFGVDERELGIRNLWEGR